jgi:hypothetical protein
VDFLNVVINYSVAASLLLFFYAIYCLITVRLYMRADHKDLTLNLWSYIFYYKICLNEKGIIYGTKMTVSFLLGLIYFLLAIITSNIKHGT